MRKIFYAVAAAFAVIFFAQGTTRSQKADIARNMDIFNAVFKEIQANYVDSIDSDKSVRTAIDAMLSQLDPYTEYIPRSEQENFKSMATLEYGGIGSYIMQRDGNVYISGPYEGSPAQRAGLRAGDLIMIIDADTVLGMTHDKVSNRLKGQAGTKVKVTVKRPYVTDSIITVEMQREKIQLPSVPYFGVVHDSIGYILLTQYTDKSADEVKVALNELKADSRIKGIILDLRDNGGGYLESAVKILGYFLPKGTEVLRTRGKELIEEKIYKTSSKPIMPDMPIAVLINSGTASASEITAGALQDLDRAVIVGSRSFGKGLVQTTRDLPFDGILKVTVSKYYIPSGRLIQAIDYSHRNSDGSVGRIPDSLTTAYSTVGGRIVRDGGGIAPDVTVQYPELSRITYNVVSDNWAFDFANKFAATHDTIPPVDKFEVTDSIYDDFKKFIDPSRFNYDKVCETILARLREAAKIEGYESDSLTRQFDILEGMMKHSLDSDLDTHRETISLYLKREIAQRYYFRRGEIQSVIYSDAAIDSAVNVLNDATRYRSLLSQKTKDKK